MVINEIFYSVQGEGRLAGVPSVFIRIAGCTLRCKWCDTGYAQSFNAGQEMTVEQVFDKVRKYEGKHFVITGGEPMCEPKLAELCSKIRGISPHITLETNGIAFHPNLDIDLMSISPKLSNAIPEGDTRTYFSPDMVSELIENYDCQLKFVVESFDDMKEIDEAVRLCKAKGRADIMLMPQVKDPALYNEKSIAVVNFCLENGYSFSPRLHIQLFGSRKGV